MGTTTSSGADRRAWWSVHRKRCNLLLVAAAPISGVLLLLVWWLFEERLPCLEITGFTGLAGLVLFLLALGLANICYFLGPLSERLIRPRNVTVFRRYAFGSGLALIGSDGRSGAMVPRNRRFVFALPARDRLEARRDGEPVIP